MEYTFVGLDVKAAGIHAVVRPTGEHWETARHDRGIAETSERLQSIHPTLVVMEANGNFELPVAGTLATMGLPFALIPPHNIREFAKATGRFRQDQTHADLLAYFAELVRPRVRPLPPELIEQLSALRKRRQQLQEMLSLERTRLAEAPAALQRGIKNHVYFLEKSVLLIGDEISRTVRSSTAWRSSITPGLW